MTLWILKDHILTVSNEAALACSLEITLSEGAHLAFTVARQLLWRTRADIIVLGQHFSIVMWTLNTLHNL